MLLQNAKSERVCVSQLRLKNEGKQPFLAEWGYRVHHSYAHEMNATERDLILQRWNVVQHELGPQLGAEHGGLTPPLERVIHALEWVRIEEFTHSRFGDLGRPPHERALLANAFVAKAVLGLTTTVALLERLTIDQALACAGGREPQGLHARLVR